MKIKSSYIIAALAILFSACGTEQEQEIAVNEAQESDNLITVTNEQFKSAGYQLGGFSEQVFETKVIANGRVDVPPKFKASVSAYFGGYVKQIDLLEGEQVSKGQVLFTLENPEFIEVQKDFLESKGQLKFLSEDLERQRNLAEANVSSKKKLAKAEAEYEMILANHAALRNKLQMMQIDADQLTASTMRQSISILSPISGYVAKINTTPGSFLSADAVAMKIIDPNHLHLELQVFEQDASRIREGQKIYFRVQNESKVREANVHLVNRNLDSDSRTLAVHAHIDSQSEEGLLVGTYVESEIVVGSDTLMALPQTAVVQLEEESFVLKAAELLDKSADFEQIKVNVGKVQSGMVPILDGTQLSENDQFLIKGAYDLIQE
jgi:cobalt-zinc-cadmium efflux system membrane fusion protein